jgi:hypothetical protein
MSTWKHELKPSTKVIFNSDQTKVYLIVGYNIDRSQVYCTHYNSKVILDDSAWFDTLDISFILDSNIPVKTVLENMNNNVTYPQSTIRKLIDKFTGLFY